MNAEDLYTSKSSHEIFFSSLQKLKKWELLGMVIVYISYK